ncbi:unnamed protein product [Phyllotreta striolata]|uniref:Uncharacterized protein n=1 Tax=Phyllotreta striolata TaxID=444603 RepID=A0A9N9TNL7_PHYSR|nr:unnamed protein product [Phyllotreta striolata]
MLLKILSKQYACANKAVGHLQDILFHIYNSQMYT